MRRRAGTFVAAVACAATLGAGLPGAAATWVIQPTPNVANAADNDLASVSCPGVMCVAVGDYTLPSRDDRPLTEIWNGTRWAIRRAALPPGNSSYFSSVSCPAAGDCIAVGANNTDTSAAVPLAEIWDGTGWALQPIPAPPGSSSLSGVSCAAVDACTAVGLYANAAGVAVPFAERWDGTAWTLQAVPAPPGGGSGLNGVSCPTTSTCFAIGAGSDSSTGYSFPLAEKWDGIRWTIQPTPQPASAFIAFLRGVSCRGTGGCTAAGTYYAGAAERILIERLRDGVWNVQTAPNPPGYNMNFLQAVSCATPAGCTVAGTAEDSNIGKSVTLVLHRGHGSWMIQPTPGPASGNPSLTGLSCGPAGCTAVGNDILPGDAGTLTTLAEHG
jgi:hypothetical protein